MGKITQWSSIVSDAELVAVASFQC